MRDSEEAIMAMNYYLVLGVSNSATADDLHAAFLRRSKELHADLAGAESAALLELQEAYEVLSDPARRRDYDRASAPRVAERARRRPPTESMSRRRDTSEPDEVLRSRGAEELRSTPEFSLADDFEQFEPSFEELFDRLWSNFGVFPRAKGERIESLNIEVVASPDEARRGGRVRMGIPARITCPGCEGHGNVGGFACWHCGGDGLLIAEEAVDVDYPAGLRDGHVVRVPLSGFGIENFYLTVVFRVSAEEASF
jgi:DnaJ-class molecular chaperone